MNRVVQMVKRLHCQAEPVPVPGFRLRTFDDPADLPAWLALRQAAFAREKLGVRAWDVTDFRHEFSSKPWWNPAHSWVIEPRVEQLSSIAQSPNKANKGDTQPIAPQPVALQPPAASLLVGSVTLAMRSSGEANRAVVHWLMVPPRYRRQGLGRWLLAVLEAQAWQLGHREVYLETHSAWEAATRFYLAAGYETL